jgi:hypothetical protein
VKEHVCDLPPPDFTDVGATWRCERCLRLYEARSLRELAEENPQGFSKTYDILNKKGRGDITVWYHTTRKRDS